jgi:hypothetical protein
MTNMTMEEWHSHLTLMADRVNAEWPEISTKIDQRRSLVLTCPDEVCAGRMSLQVKMLGDVTHFVPDTYVGSGSSLGGTPRQLLHGARRYQRLAEALLCVEHLSNGIIVGSRKP